MKKVEIKINYVEMAELPGFKVLVPKGEEEKWQASFAMMKEWDDIGIEHRVNTTGDEVTAKILSWLWAKGVASVIQRTTAKDISTVQFIVGPQCFHKFNVGRGWWDWVAQPGTLGDNLEIIEKKAKGIPAPIKEYFEPDVFMQWSGDTNYPYNMAYFNTADEVCQAFSEHAERYNVYGLDIQNFFFFARENYPRIGFLIGVAMLNIPGRHVREKHRYVYEKPVKVPDKFTVMERELIAKTEQISAADKLEIREFLDQTLDGFKKGLLQEKQLLPGIRTWYTNEIPQEPTLRRNLDWCDSHPMDKQGILQGFGEYEAKEFEDTMAELGYQRNESRK